MAEGSEGQVCGGGLGKNSMGLMSTPSPLCGPRGWDLRISKVAQAVVLEEAAFWVLHTDLGFSRLPAPKIDL